jgi:hypothetical protein
LSPGCTPLYKSKAQDLILLTTGIIKMKLDKGRKKEKEKYHSIRGVRV